MLKMLNRVCSWDQILGRGPLNMTLKSARLIKGIIGFVNLNLTGQKIRF